ncbi:hypothetical protein M0638_25590 [Roseomonas sp. NAR14]|uniref:Helix-turn-helix domain-containing protein n=1 Tax=Roseomonas acroporae TaxID=2937791 RepID=A0A9X2BZ75_9PROT|nr:hypothetical protein [Roseomonas acroporae]MCK8787739.1 hypothetical protein [Roseomonas acroporae]
MTRPRTVALSVTNTERNPVGQSGRNEESMSEALPLALRKPRLSRTEAVQYLKLAHGVPVAVATLAKLAVIGGGPAFHKPGRAVVYPRDELDRWAAEKLGKLRRSTSDRGAA